ncbi:hypothetical protein [Infirmifilum sp. SLHALR2]|nr:MAG: hypothetical protein B7L53_02940 [Thermofilum sp. NZ13]
MKKLEFYRQYNLGRMVFTEKGKPYFFEVTLSPYALDNPELLHRILAVFKSYGTNVLTLRVSAPSRGEEVRVLVSADLSAAESLVKSIVRDLESVEGVVEVRYAPPLLNGVAVDAWSHPLVFAGARAVILDEHFFKSLLMEGFGKLGDGFGGVLFYIFYMTGRGMFEEWVGKLARRVEDQVALFAEVFRLHGWGVLDFRGFFGNEAVFHVYDGLEANILRGSDVEAEFATRGLIAGFMSGVWGLPYGKVAVRETRCIRRGDPFCEIRVERKA